MISLSRADDSVLARWWWTVDRWLLAALAMLVAAGLILIFGAGTPVAERFDLPPFHFAKRQIVFLAAAIGAMMAVSLLSVKAVRRFSILLFLASLALVVLTLLIGPEYNGATRWLQIGSFTLQPSEFLKPAFIVVTAWLFAGEIEHPGFPGRAVGAALFALCAALLVAQPDMGQTLLLGLVWGVQLVLAGLPAIWIAGLAILGTAGAVLAYLTVPHVTSRIDRFLDPASGDNFQLETALNAFRAGGLFGRGPGEGAVKKALPDAHTDYVFAVAGEEFGALACLAIVFLFAVIVVRGLIHLSEEDNPFVVLAAGGLIALFGLQAFINMAVNLALMPAKGMTLPFISYGGSSMLALAIAMGMVLALTRRNRFERPSRLMVRRWV